ncbi:B-4DMT family transporter [Mycobacteroides salmoniphilum]|uniref:B-4DMT family transporter n=2 Tax=Mycobacteroides salmoniphilum TaxID=404941 RepID=UPI001B7D875D|nr:B-4DMT family transporter [Mycobacteroides salmoniphilum]
MPDGGTRSMTTQWLTRGAVFAVLMVLIRVVQGLAISVWETHSTVINIVLVLVFVASVMAWAITDGRGDARRNPDPDRRDDLAMWWLLGGIFAGVVSGLVVWLISLFNDGIYAASILAELTTTAAFVSLLVFAPAMVGVFVGRLLVDRKEKEHAALQQSDTDVFQAVQEEADVTK